MPAPQQDRAEEEEEEEDEGKEDEWADEVGEVEDVHGEVGEQEDVEEQAIEEKLIEDEEGVDESVNPQPSDRLKPPVWTPLRPFNPKIWDACDFRNGRIYPNWSRVLEEQLADDASNHFDVDHSDAYFRLEHFVSAVGVVCNTPGYLDFNVSKQFPDMLCISTHPRVLIDERFAEPLRKVMWESGKDWPLRPGVPAVGRHPHEITSKRLQSMLNKAGVEFFRLVVFGTRESLPDAHERLKLAHK